MSRRSWLERPRSAPSRSASKSSMEQSIRASTSGTSKDIERVAGFTHRLATMDDLDALREVMRRSIERLQEGFLTPEQVRVSHTVMGLDSQLIKDGTYFVVEKDGRIAGCGGWSWRSTLYGGDESLV